MRLTARQRAKEMGGPNGMELQSLPNLKGGAKPTVKLTEAEVALRRSENSRKRKHQSDKRLEDEVRRRTPSSPCATLTRPLRHAENGDDQPSAEEASRAPALQAVDDDHEPEQPVQGRRRRGRRARARGLRPAPGRATHAPLDEQRPQRRVRNQPRRAGRQW